MGASLRRDVANAINRARYASPVGESQPPKDVEDEDSSSREYAYRLADAALGLIALGLVSVEPATWQRKIKAPNADWKWVQISPSEKDAWIAAGYEVRPLYSLK